MDELDDHIKAYYAKKSLTPGQFKKIVEDRPTGKKVRRFLPYAAIFVLAIGIYGALHFYGSHSDDAILHDYAAEVAFNHKKGLQPDYLIQDVSELSQEMDRLNFEIRIPAAMDSEYDLLGGRYCSVGENIAAQLKMQGLGGDTVTVYVLRNTFDHELDNSIEVDNIEVLISNQDSLMYFLARSAP